VQPAQPADTLGVSRRSRRRQPLPGVGQYDELWWKWAGVIPGRIAQGSPLTRRQRARVRTGAVSAVLLLAGAFLVIAAIIAVLRLIH